MSKVTLHNAKTITVVDNTHDTTEERIYELPDVDGETDLEVNCRGARMVVTYAAYEEE